MKTEKYRLFAAKVNDDTMKAAMNAKHSRITPAYVLVYKSGKKPAEEFKEMGDREIEFLTKADLQWLAESNIRIMEEFAEKHREEEEKARAKFFAEFKAELEAEEKKLMEERNDGGE